MSDRIIQGSLSLLLIALCALLWHLFFIQSQQKKSAGFVPETGVQDLSPEEGFLLHGPIDINNATIRDLDAVPKIGPVLARRIYEFRESKNHVHDPQELLEIKGVGPSILKNILLYIDVKDEE